MTDPVVVQIVERPVVYFCDGRDPNSDPEKGFPARYRRLQDEAMNDSISDIMARRSEDLRTRGYRLVVNPRATHEDFKTCLYDPLTAGLIWLGHGDENGFFQAADGWQIGIPTLLRNRDNILFYGPRKPTEVLDLDRVRDNRAKFGRLKWVLILACKAGNQDDWRRLLQCDVFTFDISVKTLDVKRIVDDRFRLWDVWRKLSPEPQTEIELTDLIKALPQLPPLPSNSGI